MKFFRSNSFRKIFSVVVGVIFLNLCFILSEINALKKYHINKTLVENIERIISINGLEEEKDGSSTFSDEDEIIDLFHNRHNSNISGFCKSLIAQFAAEHTKQIMSGVRNITIEPPEKSPSSLS